MLSLVCYYKKSLLASHINLTMTNQLTQIQIQTQKKQTQKGSLMLCGEIEPFNSITSTQTQKSNNS